MQVTINKSSVRRELSNDHLHLKDMMPILSDDAEDRFVHVRGASRRREIQGPFRRGFLEGPPIDENRIPPCTRPSLMVDHLNVSVYGDWSRPG